MKSVKTVYWLSAAALFCLAGYYLVCRSVNTINSAPSVVEAQSASAFVGTETEKQNTGEAEAGTGGPGVPEASGPRPGEADGSQFVPPPAKTARGGIGEARALKCDDFANEIKKMMADAAYCKTASDCVISTEFGCPFGCYRLFNKDADLESLRDKIEVYYAKANCPQCVYDCPGPPGEEKVFCDRGRCALIK